MFLRSVEGCNFFTVRTVRTVRKVLNGPYRKSLRSVNCMSLATLKIFSALLVKLERGPKSLRSVQFVRTVKLLTVRQEEFTVRKLHVISYT